jgi:hypothetical protein
VPRKLKVFRTSTGFHDAYVAAPSRKAALAAWGADADLFARGVAEEVTDPKLTSAPLADPGEVIRISRGDLARHLEALPPRKKATKKALVSPKPARRKPPGRPPKRDRVDAAKAALGDARARHASELVAIEKDLAALQHKLEALRVRQGKELAKLQRAYDATREAYREALDRLSGEDRA